MSISSSELHRPAAFSILIEALETAPFDHPFVTMWNDEDDIRTATFGQFKRQAETLAAYFQSSGLGAGERIVLIMPQGIELMAAFAGAMMLGAVPTILAYPNFKVEPAKYRAGLAGVTANLKARIVALDNNFPEELMNYVTVGDDTFIVRVSNQQEPSTGFDLLKPKLEADGLAFIQHSAGTTGLQKGVALSNSSVLRHLDHLAAALELAEQDRIYSWLPLYHDMGLIACFMLPMVCHLPVVMQSPTAWVMQPATMLRLISDYKCTLAWVPNFTLQFLTRRVRPDDRSEYDLSHLRALINCSEPVRARSMDEFRDAYSKSGLRKTALQSSYAMAENVFAVTQSPANHQPRRLTVDARRLRDEHVAAQVDERATDPAQFVSSGRCLPGNEVRIASADGKSLPDGTVGEILIRSDSLFDGYYNRADLTEKALRGGWYWSGDLGFYLDGELYVIGRKNDLMIVGGKNIYPQDVEEIAQRHPAIHDGRAVSFGLYNPDLGTEEIIVAAEVETEEALSDSLLIERAVLSSIVAELGVAVRAVYLKPPRWIVKSTAGKPARAATRDKLIAEHDELSNIKPLWEMK